MSASAAGRRSRSSTGAGVPLEQAVEEAKDAVVDAVAEETRLRNLAEALQRRRAEIEGQRRALDEEQRVLGVRLDDNAREREALRQRVEAFEAERAGVEARAYEAGRVGGGADRRGGAAGAAVRGARATG